MGKIYSQWVDLSQDNTAWKSEKMASGFGRMVVDIDLYNDLETESTAPTGQVTFTAQTTDAESSTATISSPTIDVSQRDYARPNASGRVVYLKADLSPITGANFAHIQIWRGE